MSRKTQEQVGALVADAINLAASSGLAWDEVVAAFGAASRTLAVKAAVQDGATKDDYAALAIRRFIQGMTHDIGSLGTLPR